MSLNLHRWAVLCCWLLLFAFSHSAVLAEESRPPLIAEGEHIENYQELIANISKLSPINAIAFSPDGSVLASGGGSILGRGDNTVRLWSVAEQREIGQMGGHEASVNSVQFSPDGALLATGSDDGTVRLWSMAEGREIGRLSGHKGSVLSVAHSPDGAVLASGFSDNTIRPWSMAERLASGSSHNTIRLWSMTEGREIGRLSGHKGSVLSVAYSPDGAVLASGSSDNTIRLWSMAERREVGHLSGHEAWVESVAFSPDGTVLVSGGNDGTVRLWSLVERREIQRLIGDESSISSSAYSPDGALLALGSSNETVRLWSVTEQREIGRLSGDKNWHWMWVSSVAFSPDGALLASVSSSGDTLRLWSVAEQREIGQMSGDENSVNSMAFSPDGTVLALGISDGTVQLWSVAEQREIGRLSGHEDVLWSVTFSPDGLVLASGSNDGMVRLWNTTTHKLDEILLSGQHRNWIRCRVRDSRCWRYDDGTLLLNLDLSPVIPASHAPNEALVIQGVPDALTVAEGGVVEFTLQLRNTAEQPVYWIRAEQRLRRDRENKNPLVLYPPETLDVLKPGQPSELTLRVTAYAGYEHAQSNDWPLEFAIVSATGEPQVFRIPVRVQAPTLTLQDARLLRGEGAALQLALLNQGEQALGAASYRLRLSNTDVPLTFENPEPLAPGAVQQLSFALNQASFLKPGIDVLQENRWRQLAQRAIEPIVHWFKPPESRQDTTLSLTVNGLTYPPHRWVFEELNIDLPPLSIWIFWPELLVLALLFGLTYYYLVLAHPLVRRLSNQADALFDLPLERLPSARRWLQQARRLSEVLAQAAVSRKRFDDAVTYRQNTSPETRSTRLAERLSAERQTLAHPELKLFELRLPPHFILNVQRCLLVFIKPSQSVPETLHALDQVPAAGAVLVLLSDDIEQRQALRNTPKDRVWLWLVPDSRELTRLLFDPDPLTAFAQLLASQLAVARISPYQTRMGVDKANLFFGRRQMLADITGGNPANHLVVGARQLGKSSLLKALQRHYQNDVQVACEYISLGLSGFESQLAPKLEVAPAEVLPTLRCPPVGKHHRLLLIDEADVFLRQQAEQGYPLPNEFRNLSEQGLCYFVFAGFWSLYSTISQDYHSPLKNFGATHIIGALESEACRDLATQPMAALNIHYEESDVLVERIAVQTGGRANLIAIVCDALLSQLGLGERLIRAEHIDWALDPDATHLREPLGGWRKLSEDENASLLDQVIVYATAQLASFSHGELMNVLDGYGFAYTPEVLETALERLQRAFIFKREQGRYWHCVPVFKTMIQSSEPERSLKKLLADNQRE